MLGFLKIDMIFKENILFGGNTLKSCINFYSIKSLGYIINKFHGPSLCSVHSIIHAVK